MIRKLFYLSIIISLSHSVKLNSNSDLSTKSKFDIVIGNLGRSYPVQLWNKHFQTKINIMVQKAMLLGDEESSEEFRNLGKKAQQMVGLPENLHVPIKKVNSNSPISAIVGALAEPNAIYVNEPKLNEREYGAKFCALLHEAIHNKYNDISSDNLIELISIILVSIFSYKSLTYLKLPEKNKAIRFTASIIAGFITASLVSNKFHHYFERRADIEGHFASQCYMCVHEASVQRKKSFEKENNPLRNNGYLWSDELDKISEQLKAQGKICLFHNNKIN